MRQNKSNWPCRQEIRNDRDDESLTAPRPVDVLAEEWQGYGDGANPSKHPVAKGSVPARMKRTQRSWVLEAYKHPPPKIQAEAWSVLKSVLKWAATCRIDGCHHVVFSVFFYLFIYF